MVGVGSDKPGGAGAGAGAAAGVETAVFPARRLRGPDGARRGDRRLGRGRAAPTSSSSPATCSCSATAFVARFRNRDRQRPPRAAARLPRPRRDRPGARGRGRDDRGHGPLRRRGRRHRPADPAARGRRCRPDAIAAGLEAAVHAVEHELYPEAIRMIAEGRVRIDARRPAGRRRSMTEPAADTRDEAVERRRDPGAPGADLGLRQDRGRRLRQERWRRSGSRSSPPAAPRRRCARPGSRSPTSPSSPARRRSSAAG